MFEFKSRSHSEFVTCLKSRRLIFQTNAYQVKSGPNGRSGLDRERQDHYELRVLAIDNPSGTSEQRSAAAKVSENF